MKITLTPVTKAAAAEVLLEELYEELRPGLRGGPTGVPKAKLPKAQNLGQRYDSY
jgi:hypothetical protein